MRKTAAVSLALALSAAPLLTPVAGAAEAPPPSPRTWAADLSRHAAQEGPRTISDPGGSGRLPADPGAYTRISGPDRYAVSVAVSRAMVCAPTETRCAGLGGSDEPVDVVFVASGGIYTDALGAGPLAYGLGPLLLVPRTGTVPAVVLDEISRIAPSTVVIIGGPASVGSGVVRQLETRAPAVDRVAGADRYDTAAMVATINDSVWRNTDDDGDGQPDGHGLDTIVLVSGGGFADALGGSGAAANSRGSLLLTASTSLPTVVRDTLQQLDPATVVVAGGPVSVSTEVLAAVRAAVPDSKVVRAGGATRYEAAVALSETLFGSARGVFVVSGTKFPDALTSAPLAGLLNSSTLLTGGACVTRTTRDRAVALSPSFVTTVGGPASVSDNAMRLGGC